MYKLYTPPSIVINLNGIAKINEIFNTLIEIKISLAKFKEGGAAILAEINKNHIIIILG